MFAFLFIVLFPNFYVRVFAVCRDMNDLELAVSTSQLISSLLHFVFSKHSPCLFLFTCILFTVVKLSGCIKCVELQSSINSLIYHMLSGSIVSVSFSSSSCIVFWAWFLYFLYSSGVELLLCCVLLLGPVVKVNWVVSLCVLYLYFWQSWRNSWSTYLCVVPYFLQTLQIVFMAGHLSKCPSMIFYPQYQHSGILLLGGVGKMLFLAGCWRVPWIRFFLDPCSISACVLPIRWWFSCPLSLSLSLSLVSA